MKRLSISAMVIPKCLLLFGGFLLFATPPVAGWAQTTPVDESTLSSGAAEGIESIATADAKKNVGKKCELEFKVESATFLKDKRICFLNSESNHRNASNFSVVIIGEEALKKFADAAITDPAETYRGKTIRVVGVISLHRGSPQIKVDSPGELEVVESGEEGK